jgi:hypothetical protein
MINFYEKVLKFLGLLPDTDPTPDVVNQKQVDDGVWEIEYEDGVAVKVRTFSEEQIETIKEARNDLNEGA